MTSLQTPLHELLPLEEVGIQSFEVNTDEENPDKTVVGLAKNYDLNIGDANLGINIQFSKL